MIGILLLGNVPDDLRPLCDGTSMGMLRFFDRYLLDVQLQLLRQAELSRILLLSEEPCPSLSAYIQKTYGNAVLQRNLPASLAEISAGESFVVLPVNLLWDIALSDAIAFHHTSGQPLTLLSPETMEPSESTPVGYIVEKELTHLSFSEQLRRDHTRFLHRGFWAMIETKDDYLAAVRESLEHPHCIGETPSANGVILKDDTYLEMGAKIKPPVYIGSKVSIHKNAEILPYSVICAGTTIGENAQVLGSVIGRDCTLGAGAFVRDALVSDQVNIGENVLVPEGSFLGKDTLFPAGQSSNAEKNHGTHSKFPPFQNHCLILSKSCSAEALVTAGQLAAKLFGSGAVGIFYDGSAEAQLYANSITAGIQSTGAIPYVFPECMLITAKETCPFYGFAGGCYLEQREDRVRLLLFNREGAPLSPQEEKKLHLMLKHPSEPPHTQTIRKILSMASPIDLYFDDILRRADICRLNAKLTLETDSAALYQYARNLAYCHKVTLSEQQKEGAIHLSCNGAGTKFTFYDETCQPLTRRQIEAVIAAIAVWRREEQFIATLTTAEVLRQYVQKHHLTLTEAKQHPHSLHTAQKQTQRQYYLNGDPIYLAMQILSYLNEHHTTLAQWISNLPKAFIIEKNLSVGEHLPDAIAKLISLAKGNLTFDEGSYKIHSKKGVTLITPHTDGLRFSSESQQEEYAKELTDFYLDQCRFTP